MGCEGGVWEGCGGVRGEGGVGGVGGVGRVWGCERGGSEEERMDERRDERL